MRPPQIGLKSRQLNLFSRLVLIAMLLTSTFGMMAPTPQVSADVLTKSWTVPPGQAKKLSFDGATLDINNQALDKTTTISIGSLSQTDLADPDQGLTNVTLGPRRGYRFLPHTVRFKTKIKVILPYDKTLIPAGLTEQDIKTYFFDEQLGSWQELERVSVDTKAQEITSLTDHFTDMINATITVPDHPQPLSDNPNTIKDMQAANPGAGINLIEPPAADSHGDARLSYPIETPAGREELAPSLSLAYNSSGSSGWLGLGWDLTIPSINIDTRWGVPRYDADKETETYMLNGEMLTPVAHRGALADRSTDKVFHTRIEGQFQKIVRHGASPSQYWWEVTDRAGTRYFYGGSPDLAGGVDTAAALIDPGANANIFRWMLREVRDLNGNTVRYHYDVASGGGANGEEAWRQIYPSTIRYTGTAGGDEGPYEVVFGRAGGRPDVTVDGRAGFKTVLADRLVSIDVRLLTASQPLIRRYILSYTTGEFGKSLLENITQYGEDGTTELAHHAFEYFDEVASSAPGALQGFLNAPTVGGATTLSGDGLLLFGVNSGALQADQTGSWQASGSLGVSFLGLFGVGARGGGGQSDTTTRLTLIDLNGDGLADQVYEQGGKIYFRANTGGPGAAVNFGSAVEVPTLTALGKEHSNTYSYGGSVTVVATLSGEVVNTTSYGHAYLNDVNGDLLPDLVDGGVVYYNHLVNGLPVFSQANPVPLVDGAGANTSGMVQPPADRAKIEKAFYLVDPIRRWVAPYSGVVSIQGAVRLLAAAPAGYTTADGVRATIQQNGTEIWSTTIADPHDLTNKDITGLGSLTVSAGDRLYFRVNSIYDGSYDAVSFDPTITYSEVGGNAVDPATVDENGMPLFVYHAGAEDAYGGRQLAFQLPFNGVANLSGNLVKQAATSDDVTLEVRQGASMALVYQQTLTWDQTGSFPVAVTLNTTQGEPLQVFITADSRVDLTGLEFLPSLTYTTVEGQPAPTLPNGDPALPVFRPQASMQVYPRGSAMPYAPYVATQDGTLHVDWSVSAAAPNPPLNLNAGLTLAIKQPGHAPVKQAISIQNDAVSGTSALSADIPVVTGDVLYFTADARTDASLAQFNSAVAVQPPQVYYTSDNPPQVESLAFDLHLSLAADEAFGGGFRSWYAGQYNGDQGRGEVANLPSTCADGVDNDNDGAVDLADAADCRPLIDETRLHVPATEKDPVLEQFLPMIPFTEWDTGIDHWRVQERDAWIKGADMSASRLGAAKFLDFWGGSLGGPRGVVRLGGSQDIPIDLSLIVVGGGHADGSNWSDVDFFDFNGDTYPDVVGAGMVQATLPNGALDSQRINVGVFGRVRQADNATDSINIGAAVPLIKSNSEGDAEDIETNQSELALNAGVAGARGTFDSEWDLIDVNGDSLPDYVRQNGANLEVRLNLGYRFAAAETWTTPASLGHQEALLAGLSVGLGFSTPGYGLGGGVSFTQSSMAAEVSLSDVNGDGLLDLVSKPVQEGLDGIIPVVVSPGTNISVRFNTGNGFSTPYVLTGALARPVSSQITVARSISAQGNVSIPIGPIFLTIGGGGGGSSALGGAQVMLSDLDGDGYADHVYSDTSGNIAFQLNAHRRTNLLKKIRRPLGAVIDLDYTRSGNTSSQPQSRWVLSSVSVFDGYAGDGGDTKLITYRYADGRYDRTEREFYGYREVVEEERDPAQGNTLGRATVREYANDSYYTAGLLKKQLVQAGDGRPFTEQENQYVLRDVLAGVEPVNGNSTTATIFPKLARTDQRFYEGGATAGKSTYVTYDYDAAGNISHFFDAADAGTADDVAADIQYSQCSAKYVLNKPTSLLVTSNGTVLRHREATVDCTTGDETQVRQYLTNGDVATTDLYYTPSGLLQRVQGPANLHGQRYEVSYEYDSVIGAYMTKITDSYGYWSSATYNLKYGQPGSTTDINNNVITYAYDGFGRTESVTAPYEQGGPTPTLRFEYHPSDTVPWALTHHLDTYRDPNDPIDTALFIDGLKRVLQTKKDATVFVAPDTPAQNVMIVSGRITLDFLGRMTEQYYPVTEPTGTPGVFHTAADTQPPTTTEYDVLDRQTKVTHPDNSIEQRAYGFGPDRAGNTQFETTITDANGVQSRTYRDVRQLVVGEKRFNNAGAQVLWSSYVHDPLKQLTQLIDDHNNVTQISYDNLGRQTAVDSPDAGKTEMRYDPASNMIAKITANLRPQGKQIGYDYYFNRRISITYPDHSANNVTYTYGNMGAADNRAGQITQVTSQAGAEERFYGKLGEVVKQIKTVATFVPGSGPAVYTTQYVYDSWNRLQKIVYPDGEQLTYSYDTGGQVRAAAGAKGGFAYDYVRRLEYDKFENRAFVEAGNGVRTQYTYRPDNNRLANLKAAAAGAAPFQNLNYTYDPVGNITTLANSAAVPGPSQFGGPTAQNFTYDDLYRLTAASGTYQFAPDKTNRYTFGLVYDTIDNIMAKQQVNEIVQPSGVAVTQRNTSYAWTYSYAGPKPHATTHVGEHTFTYDANGNELGWTNDNNGTRRDIVWDEENRALSIFDNGREEAFKYDDEGNRVIKRGPHGETVYVNQYYTLRNGTIGTKQIYVGATRVVSKLEKQNAEEKDRFFYHPDHLGSSNFVTSANGALYEHLEYFPFGETWAQESSNTQLTPYLFTAKEMDEETDLYYYGARYYDARQSQFISVDPLLTEKPETALERPESLAGYTYAANNPLEFIDPDGRKVQFAPGSSRKFKRQVAEMITYLKRAGAAGVIAQLDKQPGVVYIREGAVNEMKYSPATNSIVIDPKSGLKIGKRRQTPALGFLHEAGHALQHLKNPAQLAIDSATPVAGYDDAEEKRVILNVEIPAARKLKEVIRRHHGGTAVQVKCASCRK